MHYTHIYHLMFQLASPARVRTIVGRRHSTIRRRRRYSAHGQKQRSVRAAQVSHGALCGRGQVRSSQVTAESPARECWPGWGRGPAAPALRGAAADGTRPAQGDTHPQRTVKTGTSTGISEDYKIHYHPCPIITHDDSISVSA